MNTLRPDMLDRMSLIEELARDRFERSTKSLKRAGISFALIGGHAVAHWVRTADRGADRATPNVDLLVASSNFARATKAISEAGFRPVPIFQRTTFVDECNGTHRSGVQLLVEGDTPFLKLSQSTLIENELVVVLHSLIANKLALFRTIDRVHIRDLMDVGLIDETWPTRFPPPLDDRLREILADPNG
jgi:hypothetical protein